MKPAALTPLAAMALAALACSSNSSAPAPSSTDAGPSARACAITPPTPSDWRLRADGTLLRDASNRIVSLRGVDAGGRAKTAPFVPFDYADGSYTQSLGSYMDRAASWGIDVLRVPFTWEAIESTKGTDDADFLARFDQLLDAAWARSMWTVVDFHQDVYAQNYCGDGFPAWTIPDPKPAPHHDCQSWGIMYGDSGVEAAFDRFWAPGAVHDAYVALWSRLVARYANRAGVLGFEPINEPNNGSANVDTWESTTLTAFYSDMVAKMRAAAPSSLVFVDASGFDGAFVTTKLGRPQGDGIVFAPHFYPLLGNDDSRVLDTMRPWATMGAQWNVPTFVGEFGVKDDTPAAVAYLAAHFAAFDALGIGGSQWEYSVSAQSWNAEDMSIVDGDGTEHALVGSLARPYARAIAANAGSITTSWDATARAFALTFAPTAGGVSEVALPARAFPGGYDVALTGGCYDVTSAPGRLLVQPDAGATSVTLAITAR